MKLLDAGIAELVATQNKSNSKSLISVLVEANWARNDNMLLRGSFEAGSLHFVDRGLQFVFQLGDFVVNNFNLDSNLLFKCLVD